MTLKSKLYICCLGLLTWLALLPAMLTAQTISSWDVFNQDGNLDHCSPYTAVYKIAFSAPVNGSLLTFDSFTDGQATYTQPNTASPNVPDTYNAQASVAVHYVTVTWNTPGSARRFKVHYDDIEKGQSPGVDVVNGTTPSGTLSSPQRCAGVTGTLELTKDSYSRVVRWEEKINGTTWTPISGTADQVSRSTNSTNQHRVLLANDCGWSGYSGEGAVTAALPALPTPSVGISGDFCNNPYGSVVVTAFAQMPTYYPHNLISFVLYHPNGSELETVWFEDHAPTAQNPNYNAVFSNVNGLGIGNYTVKIHVASTSSPQYSCWSAAGSVNYPAPPPNPVINSPITISHSGSISICNDDEVTVSTTWAEGAVTWYDMRVPTSPVVKASNSLELTIDATDRFADAPTEAMHFRVVGRKTNTCGVFVETFQDFSVTHSTKSVNIGIVGTQLCKDQNHALQSNLSASTGYSGVDYEWVIDDVATLTNLANYSISAMAPGAHKARVYTTVYYPGCVSGIAAMSAGPPNQHGFTVYGPLNGGTVIAKDSICQGSNYTFNASPATGGSAPYSYQWQKYENGTWQNITVNGQGEDYTVTNAQFGYLKVKRLTTDGFCTVTRETSPSELFVSPTTVAGSLSTTTPSFCSLGTAQITLNGATGKVTMWSVSSTDANGEWGGVTYFSYANQTTNTYQVSNPLTVNKTYRFQAWVKSGRCAVLPSQTVDVVVYPGSSFGTILANPAAVCASASVPVEVRLQGHAGTVNSWKYKTSDNGGTSWSPLTTITTANVDSVSLQASSPADDVKRIYLFEVKVKSGTCAQITGTKEVSVDPVTEAGEVITAATKICEEGQVNLALQGSRGTVELWQVRKKISGESLYSAWESITTANTLAVSHQLSSDTTKNVFYQYRARVQSGACPYQNTSVVTVTLNPQTEGGVLSSSKEGYGVVGDTLVLTGRVGTVVNWEKKTGSGPWNPISSTSASYTYSNLTAPLTKYRVAVQSGECSVAYSSEATISVYDEPSFPNISGNVPLPYGGSIEIETGNDYNTYQWMRNGVDLTGQTTYQLTVTRPGTYQVRVTGSPTAPVFTSGGVEVKHAMDGQVENINAVSVTRFLTPGVTATTDLYAMEVEDLMQSVTYLDGLGRPVQQVAVGGSPAKKDVVVPVQYDDKGRVPNSYLPYAHTKREGAYRPGALTGFYAEPTPTKMYTDGEQYGFYQNVSGRKIAEDTVPYAVTVYDGSPLGRVVEQGAPGEDWQPGGATPHTIRSAFRLNTTADNIKQFAGAEPEAGPGAAYPAGRLAVNETTDENGNMVLSFTNGRGQTISKKVQAAANTWLETCYVYDDWGNLRYQVPPKAMEKIHAGTAWSQAFADEWVFQYVYDTKHRLIEKKTPDAGWTYIAYDPLDRPVLVQDANLKARNKWYYTKWDIKGRPVFTGVYSSTASRSTLQTTLDSLKYLNGTQKWYEEMQAGTSNGYSNQAFPTSGTTAFQIFNYDTHDTDADGNPQYTYSHQGLAGEAADDFDAGGQLTVVRKRIVGTSSWLREFYFYDRQGRLIQTRGNNHLDSDNSITTAVYSFDGRLLTTKKRHIALGTARTVYNTYEYDHAGRLTAVYQQNPGATAYQLLARYEYNELGELVEKNLHHTGTAYLQSVDYRYNIRGWLTYINNATLTNSGPNDDTNDFFGMQLRYTGAETGLVSSTYLEYNGNVAAVKWKNLGDGAGEEGMRGYLYHYDKSDRLTKGTSKKYVGDAWINVTAFDEQITYDANGNISTMTRNKPDATGASGTGMDNLTFTYAAGQGNRLSKVTNAISNGGGYTDGANAANEMTYDAAGNLNKDLNKGISSITYNDLNKPEEVVFGGGRKIRYTYDGAGTKLTQTVYRDSTHLETIVDYVDGFEYHGETLRYFAAPEGRVVHNSGVYDYEYAIADHQGNTRAVFTSKETTYTYNATFETAASGLRQDTDLYLNVDPTKEVTMASYNNTPGGSKAVRMSSSYKAGPAFAVRVLPGDRVDAEVFGAFEGNNFNSQASLGTMITAVAGAFGGVSGAGGESGNIYTEISTAMTALGLPADGGSTVPNAYLNFIFLDELTGFNKTTQFDDGGFVPVPSNAYQSKKKINIPTFTASKPGYLYIYLSFEEEGTSYYVHFDDFKVTYTPSKLIQTTDYYPFGASHSSSWTRETATPNPYLYNAGSEKNERTGWYETAFRGYDAYTGRFQQVDPLADMFGGMNPYHYGYNNPTNFNDPMGLMSVNYNGDGSWDVDFSGGGESEKWTEPQDASSGGDSNYGPPMTFPQFSDMFNPSQFAAAAYGDGVNNFGYNYIPGKFYGSAALSTNYDVYVTSKAWYTNGRYNGTDVTGFRVEKSERSLGEELADAAYKINKFNPLAIAINGVKGLATGTDTYGQPMSEADAYFNIASSLPIFGMVRTGKTVIHHIASNKHLTRYTPQFEAIAEKYKLKLSGSWNKVEISTVFHYSKHPDKYHEFVLKGMREADAQAGGSTAKFLEVFDNLVKKPLLDNPMMLNGGGW